MADRWTILAVIEWTTGHFKRYQIETARLDAELLLAHVLGVERTQLYINFDQPLQRQERDAFKQLVLRRAKREPIAYITGNKEFWSLDFKVNPNVLIPRPETEALVQIVVDLWKKQPHSLQSRRNHKANGTVLDIGTGCGNIAISLAKEIPDVRVLASDISPGAVEMARENARLHQLDGSLNFWRGDLFEPFQGAQLEGKIDFIVSNPPYIPTAQLAALPPEVNFEPRLALDGGLRGSSLQQRIMEESLRFLAPGGCLVMETGGSQAEHIKHLGCSNPQWAEFQILPDYSGLPRVILGKRG